MNKKLLSFGATCLFALTSLVAVSCGEGPVNNSIPSNGNSIGLNEEGEPYVTSLEIVTMPTKTIYNEGEIFDGSGMTLKAVWSHKDEETGENIAEDLSTFDVQYSKEPLKSNATSVTVTYENKSVDVPIKVNSVVITGLNIFNLPNMTTFTTNEKFTLDGLILHVVLENGDKMILEKGYTVTIDGKDVTNEVLGEGKLFAEGNYEVVLTYKDKSISFFIRVIDGIEYTVEAEKLLGSHIYPTIQEDDKNYIEPNDTMVQAEANKTHIMQNSNEPASGSGYLGELNKIGKGFTINIYSEVATKTLFSMRASSCVIETSVPGDVWKPTAMKNIQLNQLIKVVANNKDLNIDDNVVLPGGTIKDVGEGNNSLLWVNWQTVDLGVIDLVQGYNKIYFELIDLIEHGSGAGRGAINIDFFNFINYK